jgi:hypothetical protein
MTLATFWRITPRLAADLDGSVTRARFVDVGEDRDRIPGALANVVATGVSWDPQQDGPLASIRLRRLGGYPLIEDDSDRAPPTSIVNLSAGYRRGPAGITLSLLNGFDAADADIQYFYESRAPAEPAGIEGIHFHPIEPRQLRLALSWGF